jgi:DNA polymerase-3 subunit alpha
MRRALIDMQPDRFEDLIALVALYRPGPMANIPTYCSRKLGREPVLYLHPKLRPILEETYGIITYQEQVMQIAQDLAGYTLGEADLLRRAMGKKIRSEMEKQRVRFTSGAVDRGLLPEEAEAIFEACAKFADYGFNKSHSAPYALITYQTAFLKANFPVEFFAASMSLELNNTDKINDFRHEAQRLGIKIDPPSVISSGVTFEISDGRILYALGALKGVGEQAAEHIIQLRGSNRFRSITDFAARISPRIINKRVLEALIAAGALDGLEPDRARLFSGTDHLLGLANRSYSNASDGQDELFGLAVERESLLPRSEPWSGAERLQREHGAVGFYLSAHPLDQHRSLMSKLRVQSWQQFSEAVRAGATAGRLAGTVTSRQERKTKSGGRVGIVQLSDPSGQYEAILFSESLTRYRDLLEPGCSVLLLVTAEERPEGLSVKIQSAEPLEKTLRGIRQARVFLDAVESLPRLRPMLAANGQTDVSLILRLSQQRGEVELKLPPSFSLSPEIAGRLRGVPGVVEVELL